MNHHSSLLAALPLLAFLAPVFTTVAAQAQPRDFKCIGAERLEDDVFEVPFPAHSARPNTAARTPVAAAAALATADPSRNICVLGHATREGGQSTTTELAARRAREVAELLSVGHRIDRDRIRAEARNPGFSRRTENREARSVTIVVLPAAIGTGTAPQPPMERTAPRAAPPVVPPATIPVAPPATVPAPAAPPVTAPAAPPVNEDAVKPAP
jgi:hypothetical protein